MLLRSEASRTIVRVDVGWGSICPTIALSLLQLHPCVGLMACHVVDI
jgi:hypothetical protein